jgi:hypothetical protein
MFSSTTVRWLKVDTPDLIKKLDVIEHDTGSEFYSVEERAANYIEIINAIQDADNN